MTGAVTGDRRGDRHKYRLRVTVTTAADALLVKAHLSLGSISGLGERRRRAKHRGDWSRDDRSECAAGRRKHVSIIRGGIFGHGGTTGHLTDSFEHRCTLFSAPVTAIRQRYKAHIKAATQLRIFSRSTRTGKNTAPVTDWGINYSDEL